MNAKCVLSSRLAGAALLATSFAAVSTHAQDYPSKPIRMIVPFAAAGILDIVARAVGERLAGLLGRQRQSQAYGRRDAESDGAH